MIVAIHQPQYLPWIGYLDKLDQADRFVLLDSVQFTRQGWQNRNRIRTAAGWQWLSVPVRHAHPQRIDQVELCQEQPWAAKHWHALRTNYGRTPWFRAYEAGLGEIYTRPWRRLADLNHALIACLVAAFGIETRIETAPPAEELPADRTGRLVAICRRLGADRYLCGAGGLGYLDLRQFDAAGIEVVVQDFTSPIYPQGFPGFVPDLAGIDLLFNCGPGGMERLRRARRPPLPARRVAALPHRGVAAAGAGR